MRSRAALIMGERSFEASVLWFHHTPLVVIDSGCSILYANRAATRMLASDRPLEGENFVALFDDHENLVQAIDRAIRGGEEQSVRLSFRRGERIRDIDLTLSLSAETVGLPSFTIAMYDVELRDMFDERTQQLDRMALEERLIGGFAHQLRNPLAAVSALIENLAAETEADDPRAEYTERLLNQVARMEQLIRSCVAFGPDVSTMPRRRPAERIARAAIEQLTVRRGIVPHLEVEDGVQDVFVNEKQIGNCLLLLMERAFESCGAVDKMALRVSPDAIAGGDRFVRFTVFDEGPAVDEGDLEMLFEPFQNSGLSGIGMGLAIAQTLALKNGGMLEVRSQPGDTQLILRLPAVPLRVTR